MANKKRVPKSQHRQYQTPSRAARREQQTPSGKPWFWAGGAVVLLVALAVVYWLNRRSIEGEVIRPLASVPPAERNGFYDTPPEMSIDPSHDYQALIDTDKGQIKLDLFETVAPITVNSFVFLARQGFYDGVTFHRVLDGFMAQGGDPSGSGSGGPGYAFEDETTSELVFDRPGLLAMANAGANTNGSQFFITFAPTPHLNGLHTIFGEVLEGFDVLDALTRRDPQTNPSFPGDQIQRITILEDGTAS